MLALTERVRLPTVKGSTKRLEDALGHGRKRLVDAVAVGDDDREFVTAEAGQGVLDAQARPAGA